MIYVLVVIIGLSIAFYGAYRLYKWTNPNGKPLGIFDIRSQAERKRDEEMEKRHKD